MNFMKLFKYLNPLNLILAFFLGLDAKAAEDFGLSEAAREGGLISGSGQPPSIQQVTGQIIGGVLAFVGVIFLILTIYGGITWMTAGGNEEKIKKAKGLIVNSIIGVIIILAAYTIVNYIFASITATTTGGQ